jgi:diguanylate cyclase (GGDEF)-like protein/PAS domain S-box-containing protein
MTEDNPESSIAAIDSTALLGRVPAIVYVSDLGPAGRWHYVSPGIEPILGFTPEEWLASPRMWLDQLHPDDRGWVIADEQHDQEAGVGHTAAPVEYRMLHRDGHVVWIRDESILQADRDGVLRWYGVLSDVSARKRAELALERRAAASAAVARIGAHALQRASVPHLLDEACAAAASVLGVEWVTACEVDTRLDSIVVRAQHGLPATSGEERIAGLNPDTQMGHVLRTGEPTVVRNWRTERRFEKSEPLVRYGAEASICARIEGDGGPWGALGVLSSSPRDFLDADVHFVQALANVVSDAIMRQRVEDSIEHRALHDPLTGLPNRVLFLDRLAQAFERVRRRRSLTAVLFIDIDHFKHVNDSLGHHAGDELLAAVATRLRETVRPTDTVARLSGDEFALLLEEITTERDAIATAERVAAGFARPFALGSTSHFVTASIGIALADGHELPADLMRDADAAMYRAKERGRARYDLFDEDMRLRAVARMRLENELRLAIDRQELRLAYQPVVRLRDELIVGAEALIRWDHPERGVILPSEFMDVAEETGLIDRLGQWALEEACRDAARWALARPDSRPLTLGINLSGHQLSNPRLPERVAEALQSAEFSAEFVQFEIAESTLLDDGTGLRRTLRRLRGLGAGLVVHDLGIGRSSLTQLAALELTAIKLDRRLVAALDDQPTGNAAARAVIAVGHALDLEVIAEGTETAEQVQELRALGCEKAQGHLFAKAIRPDELTELLVADAHLRRTVG